MNEKAKLLLGYNQSSEENEFGQNLLHTNEDHNQHSRAYNVFMDFIIFIVVIIEISLVLYLSISHFMSSQELEGLVMLFPLFLNSVGVIYFLSDLDERKVLNKTSNVKCFTDLYQLPIIGPVLTALKTLILACGCCGSESNRGDVISYSRIEASATKMRQAVTYFSGAPEALVQLTVLLCSEKKVMDLLSYMEIAVVVVIVIAMAEANVYSLISPYYRIFHKYQVNDWKLPEISFKKKIVLFLHALTSLGTSLISAVFLISSAKYYFKTKPFPYILVLIILFIVGFRMCFYYICRLAKHFARKREVPSGCYESIMYGWRTTILDFGFQSSNDFIQIYFYIEKILSFALWFIIALKFADDFVKEMIFLPLAALFWSCLLFSLILLLICQRFNLAHLRTLNSDLNQ